MKVHMLGLPISLSSICLVGKTWSIAHTSRDGKTTIVVDTDLAKGLDALINKVYTSAGLYPPIVDIYNGLSDFSLEHGPATVEKAESYRDTLEELAEIASQDEQQYILPLLFIIKTFLVNYLKNNQAPASGPSEEKEDEKFDELHRGDQ